MSFATQHCVPCTGDMPGVSAEEANRRLGEVPGWNLIDDGKRLERRFKFRDFVSAVGFVDKLAPVCEEQNHHPDLRLGWGYVTVTFSTHAIRSLSDNDFIMAAKVSALFEAPQV